MRVEKLNNEKLEAYLFDCPGCGDTHMVTVRDINGQAHWTFNGDMDKPTFHPSLLCRVNFGYERTPRICHSFIRDGKIQFLGDCTHKLAGQTVDLPDLKEGDIKQ